MKKKNAEALKKCSVSLQSFLILQVVPVWGAWGGSRGQTLGLEMLWWNRLSQDWVPHHPSHHTLAHRTAANWKGKGRIYVTVLMTEMCVRVKMHKCRVTYQIFCCWGQGAVLSAFCRTELCCCCVWGCGCFGWSWRRSDDPHRTSTGSYRPWDTAERETPHSLESPPAPCRVYVFEKLYDLTSINIQGHSLVIQHIFMIHYFSPIGTQKNSCQKCWYESFNQFPLFISKRSQVGIGETLLKNDWMINWIPISYL